LVHGVQRHSRTGWRTRARRDRLHGTDRALTEIYYGTSVAGARDGEVSVLWLKALGVQAVGVSGLPAARFTSRSRIRNSSRVLLEPLWRDGDDVFYRVGKAGASLGHSLAHVVPRSDIVLRTPENGIDVDPLRSYVAALEDGAFPRAEFEWTSQHFRAHRGERSTGSGDLDSKAWHKGWHATANGARDSD